MNNSPKISVIMSVYNCESTLKAAIESIINQTYKNWELIICDDYSSDRTYQIAFEYFKKYQDKIKLLKNAKNLKLAKSLNHCLKHAKGDYIARMDGDDISCKERFLIQVNFLINNPTYDLVGSQMFSVDEKKNYRLRSVKEKPNKYDLRYGSPFAHATIMAKRKVFLDLRGYRSNYLTTRCEDVDFWIRFFEKEFKGYNIQNPLYIVTENNEAFSRRKFAYGFNATHLLLNGYKKLNFPFYYYLFAFKPSITYIFPQNLLKVFHHFADKKINKNNIYKC